jgi:vacuolar-type H+-ATPase subunit E/Vma4
VSGESPDRLLQELEAQVAAEAAGLLTAAREEAARIRAEGAERVAAARAAALGDCEEATATGHATALAASRLEGRRLVLEAQHAAVERVLAEVPRQASDIARTSRVRDADLQARVAVVLAYLGEEAAELRCAPVLYDRLVRALPDESKLRVCPDQKIAAGIRGHGIEGRIVVDDSLEGWLVTERQRLAIEILRSLGTSDGRKQGTGAT